MIVDVLDFDDELDHSDGGVLLGFLVGAGFGLADGAAVKKIAFVGYGVLVAEEFWFFGGGFGIFFIRFRIFMDCAEMR